MRYKKQCGIPLVALLFLTVGSVSAFADLDAQAIVDKFNGMNGGQGFLFSSDNTKPLPKVTTRLGTENTVDISAYTAAGTAGTDSNGLRYFTTFCVQPKIYAVTSGAGLLNYSDGLTKNSSDIALSLGAAYLYKLYAAGSLNGMLNTENNIRSFLNALRVLNDDTGPTPATTAGSIVSSYEWANNAFLNGTYGLTDFSQDQQYWMAKYDPGQYYVEIGYYSVFIMQVQGGQDFLYIACASPAGVPEPATLLLWSLGGMGLTGTSWAHKRRLKKLALS